MEDSPRCTARQLVPFALIAYGLPFLMGIPLAIAQRAGYPTDIFANAQMYYPAAGAIAALLLTGQADAMPRRFFVFHLICTGLMALCCLGTVILPGGGWLVACNLIVILGSLAGWGVLLAQKKELRQAAGLGWQKGKLVCGCVVLYILLRTALVFASAAIGGQLEEYLAYWVTPAPYLVLVMLIPNFFLSFAPFWGEEYGWRYFLQPRLQNRFGMRGGVLLLGVLWGLWHLPLNFFFYAPDTALQSVASQLITCVTLGIFFAWAYLKTGNIWAPVLLHFFNNNLTVVYTGTTEISNQTIGWLDVGLHLVLMGVVFLPFLASPVFGKKAKVQ